MEYGGSYERKKKEAKENKTKGRNMQGKRHRSKLQTKPGEAQRKKSEGLDGPETAKRELTQARGGDDNSACAKGKKAGKSEDTNSSYTGKKKGECEKGWANEEKTWRGKNRQKQEAKQQSHLEEEHSNDKKNAKGSECAQARDLSRKNGPVLGTKE